MSHTSNGYYFFMYSYDMKYDVLDDNGNCIETKTYSGFKSYYTRPFDRESHVGERNFRGAAYESIAARIEGMINRMQEENNQKVNKWAEEKRANPSSRAPKPARRRYAPYNQMNVGTIAAGSRGKGQSLPADTEGKVCDPNENKI